MVQSQRRRGFEPSPDGEIHGLARAWMVAGEAAQVPEEPPEKEAERESAQAARGGSRAGVGLGASEQQSARSARAADGPPEDLNTE